MIIHGVVPAAGRGTRLRSSLPKILTPITPTLTTLDLLRTHLEPRVDTLHLIVAPEHHTYFTATSSEQIHIQNRPTGMGDAVFVAASGWKTADHIIVVWGDQALLSAHTIDRAIKVHTQTKSTHILTIPLARVHNPYVEYRLSDGGLLRSVLESREEDVCASEGWSDAGIFVLSTNDLIATWKTFKRHTTLSKVTAERGFIPIFPHLVRLGWTFNTFEIDDPDETRGINTQEDLLYVRSQFNQQRKPLCES